MHRCAAAAAPAPAPRNSNAPGPHNHSITELYGTQAHLEVRSKGIHYGGTVRSVGAVGIQWVRYRGYDGYGTMGAGVRTHCIPTVPHPPYLPYPPYTPYRTTVCPLYRTHRKCHMMSYVPARAESSENMLFIAVEIR